MLAKIKANKTKVIKKEKINLAKNTFQNIRKRFQTKLLIKIHGISLLNMSANQENKHVKSTVNRLE